jgi:hypothetical protein
VGDRREDEPPVNGSLRRLRLSTGYALGAVLSLMLLAEVFRGNFGIALDYRVEPIIVGTVLGAILLIVGIEVGSRWPWGPK